MSVDLLAQWQADEAAVRARRTRATGTIAASEASGRAGLAVLCDGRLPTEGRTIHVGRQAATADGRLVGPDGRLYAHASSTCLVFDWPGTASQSSP